MVALRNSDASRAKLVQLRVNLHVCRDNLVKIIKKCVYQIGDCSVDDDNKRGIKEIIQMRTPKDG